jgi:hypothetical protein
LFHEGFGLVNEGYAPGTIEFMINLLDQGIEGFIMPFGVVLGSIRQRLLLDSRVVDLSRSSNLIVVTLCSLKLSFFNCLKKALHFSDNVGA